MAEWSKAHDWKSCVPPKGTVSSNLTLSAIKNKTAPLRCFFVFKRDEWEKNSRRSEFDYKRKADFWMQVGKADERSGTSIAQAMSRTISLYPPLKTKQHPCGAFLFLNVMSGRRTHGEVSSTTSERQTSGCRSAKPMSAVERALHKQCRGQSHSIRH